MRSSLSLLFGGLLLVHAWYPADCCGGSPVIGDCKPVPCDSLAETKDGVTWRNLTFRDGQVRPSLDAQCHVCAGETNGMPAHPHCVFIQPAS